MDNSPLMIMSNTALNHHLSKIPTPCFVLDEDRLIRNLQILNKIQNEAGIQILCAFKGFAMWSTFPLLKKYLNGATASSLHEAMLCQEEWGVKPHLCAPIYRSSEFDQYLQLGSHITFNSLSQYERLGHKAYDSGLQLALRINPEYSEVTTDLYNPCIPGSRLGIIAQDIPDQLPEQITGLHFHTLCEQNANTLRRTLEEVEKKFEKHLYHISWFNIGGGHHFTRTDYQVDEFVKFIVGFKEKYNLEIIAEPGEAIGLNTGFLIATVEDIVESNGIKTAMLDTSFAAHMPDCLEMPYQPHIIGSTEPGPGRHTYRMGGHTCLAGDLMGDYHFDKPLSPGDKIVFDDMIHYTMVKTNTFNGVQLPAIGIVKQDGSFKLVRKFDYSDYKSRLS